MTRLLFSWDSGFGNNQPRRHRRRARHRWHDLERPADPLPAAESEPARRRRNAGSDQLRRRAPTCRTSSTASAPASRRTARSISAIRVSDRLQHGDRKLLRRAHRSLGPGEGRNRLNEHRRARPADGVACDGRSRWQAWRGRCAAVPPPVFGPSVWRGEPGRKAIALTFDDGPSPATPRILDILAGYGVPATFFQCGANVLRASGTEPGRVCRAARNRQSFSYAPEFRARASHRLSRMNSSARRRHCGGRVRERPVLMRPPFGVRWFGFREMQRASGIDVRHVERDRSRLETARAADCRARSLAHASDGAIICLHDGRGTLKDPDVEADGRSRSPHCSRRCCEKGYHFETVSQLLCRT